MKVKVNKDITIYEPTEEVMTYCQKCLEINNPDYLIALRLGNSKARFMPQKLKLYVKNGDSVVLPYGCIDTIWGLLRNSPFSVDFSPFKPINLNGNIKLYDYQQKALNRLLQAKHGVLEAPCGSGKTQIGLELIHQLGCKALWLTHTKKLLTQSLERCEKYFQGDFGTITEGEVHIGKDITFATVQTISKVDSKIYENEFNTIVVDECHHCVGTPTKMMMFYKVLSNCNAKHKYGLSATLNRSDNMISTLFSILGDVKYTIPKEAVGDKIIKARHVKVEIDFDYDIEEYCDTDGTIDYNALINMLSNDTKRNDIIINNVLENKAKKQLILCHRVAQCETLYNILKEKGLSCSLVVGNIKDKDREYSSQVIIATFALAKEGLDIPTLEVLHLATPQKNESITIQSVGRIERNIEGKETPVCFDYVDVNIPYCNRCFTYRKRFLNKK